MASGGGETSREVANDPVTPGRNTEAGNSQREISKYDEDFVRKWGFPLRDLYRHAVRFYKDKEGKAVHFSYKDKLKLVALTKQVSVGPFNLINAPPLGVLDVIGRDRREAWHALADMTTEDAMASFVELLDGKCLLFRPFVEAHKADLENRKRLQEEEEKRRLEEEARERAEEEARARLDAERARQESQKRQIQEALNQQTYAQFKAYAEQQYPANQQQQELLLRQLQEQHYHQYMDQLMQSIKAECQEAKSNPVANGDTLHDGPHSVRDESEDDEPVPQAPPPNVNTQVIPMASMWTRKDVKEFKESIRKEGGDAVIRVGHGETVTVRVPTNEEGNCLFWEFATDYYDIGFGVYFEWTKSPTNQVSVHVSESEDDDDDEEDDDDDYHHHHHHHDIDDDEFGQNGAGALRAYRNDVESGGGGGGRGRSSSSCSSSMRADRPPLSIIVPVYRRECQDEVYAGSHAYPGRHGVYLLKFDNSYSLWRSKTLYYRVYYTR